MAPTAKLWPVRSNLQEELVCAAVIIHFGVHDMNEWPDQHNGSEWRCPQVRLMLVKSCEEFTIDAE